MTETSQSADCQSLAQRSFKTKPLPTIRNIKMLPDRDIDVYCHFIDELDAVLLAHEKHADEMLGKWIQLRAYAVKAGLPEDTEMAEDQFKEWTGYKKAVQSLRGQK